MPLWIVIGNAHPTIKSGTYLRDYDDHYRIQRVIPTPGHHFRTEDASRKEIPLNEPKLKVFPVGQPQNRKLFQNENGHAIAHQRNKVSRPKHISPILLPGEDF